jgi:hypothetical protein
MGANVEFGTIVTVIGVVSGILGIIAYFLPIETTKARYVHGAYVLAIAIAVSVGTYEATRYARLNSIARNAAQLNHNAYYQQMTPDEYIQAALVFLEKRSYGEWIATDALAE